MTLLLKILKKCKHKNIVRFIDLIEAPKYVYIVTEFCRNGDLKELLNSRKLTEDEGFQIIMQISEGFKELQKNGIIHRDLKPANILIDSGVYKIADFGFAKVVNNYNSTNMLRSLVGSPYYMAPQLLAYQQYCYKCDVWSLAVIYYEIIFGELPWLANDPQGLLKKIIQVPIISKIKSAKISNFSKYFLEKALIIDEIKRPGWDEIFAIVQQNQKQSVVDSNDNINSSQLHISKKKSIFEQNSNPLAQTQSEILPPSREMLEEQNELFQKLSKLRQVIIIKHYIATEMLVNIDELNTLLDNEVYLMPIICILTRIVLQSSQLLLNLMKEKEQSKPEIMNKDILQLIQKTQQEHEYYLSFQRDIKEKGGKMSNNEISNVQLVNLGVNWLNIVKSQFDKIREQSEEISSLMILIEQFMSLIKVLQHLDEDDIDYDDILQSKINEDQNIYIELIETNLNAITLNE